MRTTQHLRMTTHVAMTPQLVQSIRLLQLSADELEQEVLQTLERNVMLERTDDAPGEAAESPESEPVAETAPREEDWPLPQHAPARSDDEDDAPRDRVAAPNGVSLQARAMVQLSTMAQSPREARLLFAILEAIDDNGYLERTLADIGRSAGLAPAPQAAELEAALAKVQQLDPPGFGARDLGECLRLQLLALPPRTPARSLALAIVDRALPLLAERDRAALAARFEVEPDAVEQALRLIRGLDPHPGRQGAETAEYVIPDLVVRGRGFGYAVELNGAAAPRVRVNKLYERMLSGCGDNAESLRTQLQEARWLVRGLEMRHQTLLKAARAIFARQHRFLTHGDEGLVPLTLQEVADAIGMHESTFSRITANKYVRTPRGVLPLRHFFCSTVTARAGVEASGAAVRALVRRHIESENPGSPLADGTIAALLARQGIGVARRTVAKYREAMHIPSAKERRLAALNTPLRKAS